MQQLQPFLFPLLMVVMMGWMIFSQSKRQKEQQKQRQETLNQIKKGDEIVTIGGLYGIVDAIDEQFVVLDVDGIYLTFDRAAIRGRAQAPAAPVEAASGAIEE